MISVAFAGVCATLFMAAVPASAQNSGIPEQGPAGGNGGIYSRAGASGYLGNIHKTVDLIHYCGNAPVTSGGQVWWYETVWIGGSSSNRISGWSVITVGGGPEVAGC